MLRAVVLSPGPLADGRGRRATMLLGPMLCLKARDLRHAARRPLSGPGPRTASTLGPGNASAESSIPGGMSASEGRLRGRLREGAGASARLTPARDGPGDAPSGGEMGHWELSSTHAKFQ